MSLRLCQDQGFTMLIMKVREGKKHENEIQFGKLR